MVEHITRHERDLTVESSFLYGSNLIYIKIFPQNITTDQEDLNKARLDYANLNVVKGYFVCY